MSEPDLRLDLILRGRVQGVGFRWWTRSQAEMLGIRGTVRNRADNSVEVHAAGPADRIRRFRSLLEDGPRAAQVTATENAPPSSDPLPSADFRIMR